MPEGPSMVLLNEALQPLLTNKSSMLMALPKKVDYGGLPGANLRELKTWERPLYPPPTWCHPFPSADIRIPFPKQEQNSKT